ncbi:MAG: hypothetical protein IT223_02240, partial [Crocinitomicaceae bacterium]|nr:hypothetical protein [Crocinitomicaceae bacterium]
FPLPASASFASHNESGTPLSTNIPLFSVNLVIVFFVAYIIYRRFIGRWWPENKTTGIILSGIIILVYVLSIWFIADYELRRWSSHSVPWPDEWSIVGFHLR